MATFDGLRCILTISAPSLGINDVIDGFPSGTMFTATLDAPAFKLQPTVGSGLYVATHLVTGKVVLRISRESRANTVLSLIHGMDKLIGSQIFALTCVDLNAPGAGFLGISARIEVAPPYGVSNEEAPPLEWSILVADLSINHATLTTP